MATAYVRVDVTMVTPHEWVTLWCPACALPSGIVFPYVMSWRSDPTRLAGRGEVRRCVECGAGL